MKKLSLLIITILIAFTSFSQIATNNDSGVTCLPNSVLRGVAKDIILKEKQDSIILYLNQNFDECQLKSVAKDNIIFEKQTQSDKKDDIINLNTQKVKIYSDSLDKINQEYKQLSRKFKWNKIKNTTIQGTGAAAMLFLVYKAFIPTLFK